MELVTVDAVIRWLHLMATVVWIGGLFFMVFVLSPPATGRGIPPSFIRLMGMNRFKYFVWSSIVVLGVTGILNTTDRVSSLEQLFATAWGIFLVIKHILIIGMVTLTALNTLYLGPKVISLAPTPGPQAAAGPAPELVSYESMMVLFSKINLALGFAVLLIVAILTP